MMNQQLLKSKSEIVSPLQQIGLALSQYQHRDYYRPVTDVERIRRPRLIVEALRGLAALVHG